MRNEYVLSGPGLAAFGWTCRARGLFLHEWCMITQLCFDVQGWQHEGAFFSLISAWQYRLGAYREQVNLCPQMGVLGSLASASVNLRSCIFSISFPRNTPILCLLLMLTMLSFRASSKRARFHLLLRTKLHRMILDFFADPPFLPLMPP